jgi:hypothetical protein
LLETSATTENEVKKVVSLKKAQQKSNTASGNATIKKTSNKGDIILNQDPGKAAWGDLSNLGASLGNLSSGRE